MNFEIEIYDRCEGTIRRTISCESEESAHEEASILAAELGCRQVEEVIVMEVPK